MIASFRRFRLLHFTRPERQRGKRNMRGMGEKQAVRDKMSWGQLGQKSREFYEGTRVKII